MMTLEITDYLINRIWWNVDVPYLDTVMAHVKLTIYLVALWVLALTLSFCLISPAPEAFKSGEHTLWRKVCAMSGTRLMLMVVACLAIGLLLHFIMGKSEAVYKVIVCTLLILLACGRNYRKNTTPVLSSLLWCYCCGFSGAGGRLYILRGQGRSLWDRSCAGDDVPEYLGKGYSSSRLF